MNLFDDPRFDEVLLENYEQISRNRKATDAQARTMETQGSNSKTGNPNLALDSTFDVTHMTSKLKEP